MTTKPQQNVEIVHGRRVGEETGILPYRSEGLVADVVDSPDFAGKISVTRNVQDDPVAGMYARRFIDAAQLAAARHWQQAWEAAQIGQIQAVDTTKEPVDGTGPPRPPFTDKQREAFKELQMAALVLGYEGDRIIREVLAERMSLMMVSIRHHRPKKYIGMRFREALESMAKLWSYA
jgi:hypothetical protein